MSSGEEKSYESMKNLSGADLYNRPTFCAICDGIMVFKGVGEYVCEHCGWIDYDDYGKVRNFVEKNPGVNPSVVSRATGVSRKVIREMLKDSRFEIASNSPGYLRCELCGESVRHGRFCLKCEAAYHKNLEDRARMSKRRDEVHGHSVEPKFSGGGVEDILPENREKQAQGGLMRYLSSPRMLRQSA